MNVNRKIRLSSGTIAFTMMALVAGNAAAQLPKIVINEIVDDIRTAGSGGAPDDREFIELYNADTVPVNIGDWTLNYWLLNNSGATTPVPPAYAASNDTIPTGTILQPGDYYVVGHPNVPNVDLAVNFLDLFPDNNVVYELRNGPQATGVIVDAVGSETFRGQELGDARPEQLPELGRGWWGQMISPNAADPPNKRISLARYRDGVDTNRNGADFGVLPLTPGAANSLPTAAGGAYTVPDVQALALGSDITSTYASFVFPRVIDPTSATNFNPKAIPASPTGGKAIITYDETGGGNVAYSKEYVNSFRLSAYIETGALNSAAATDITDSEATIYGIGTSDPFFAMPNSVGILTATNGAAITSSANGSTGLGWLIHRVEKFNTTTSALDPTRTILQLIDMKGGGESVPTAAAVDWEVVQEIELTGTASGWHTLGIDYNPNTGAVTATFDSQSFNHTTDDGMLGTFYVGYREDLGAVFTNSRPPTYDIAPPAAVNDADFDNDGDADGQDFLIWQRGLGAGSNATGDANGDGQVNAGDLAIWKAQFGIPAAVAASAVPEPAGFALGILAVGALAGCGKPRRNQRIA